MYIKEKRQTHFLNLIEDLEFAKNYFQRIDTNNYNNNKLMGLQDNLQLAKRKYNKVNLALKMAYLFRINSMVIRLEKEHRNIERCSRNLENFESELAYLIISKTLSIEDCLNNRGFALDYLKKLLEKYKKQILNPFVEYDYDEKRDCVSEILDDGMRIILPYKPSIVRRKIMNKS